MTLRSPVALVLAVAGCATLGSRRASLAPLPRAGADTLRSEVITAGVRHEFRYHTRGPWAIHLLDIDRAACWSLAAAKGGATAAGRRPASAIVTALAGARGRDGVAGGINADFFLFDPPGVPQGAHVEDGRVFAGPAAGRPVVAVDDSGAVIVTQLTLEAEGVGGAPLDTWNRPARAGVALLDERYGAPTDTATGTLVLLASLVRSAGDTLEAVVTLVDSTARQDVAAGTIALVAGPGAPVGRRRALAAHRLGDSVRVIRRLLPRTPHGVVGGRPVLVSGGVVDSSIDTTGTAGFRGPNPRTALFIAEQGRRLVLLTVDGRQPGYSGGMTLRELADYALTLGAHDAINLDGGGSTTMVVREAEGYRVVNRPSDREGERPVANALAVVRGHCAIGDPHVP